MELRFLWKTLHDFQGGWALMDYWVLESLLDIKFWEMFGISDIEEGWDSIICNGHRLILRC